MLTLCIFLTRISLVITSIGLPIAAALYCFVSLCFTTYKLKINRDDCDGNGRLDKLSQVWKVNAFVTTLLSLRCRRVHVLISTETCVQRRYEYIVATQLNSVSQHIYAKLWFDLEAVRVAYFLLQIPLPKPTTFHRCSQCARITSRRCFLYSCCWSFRIFWWIYRASSREPRNPNLRRGLISKRSWFGSCLDSRRSFLSLPLLGFPRWKAGSLGALLAGRRRKLARELPKCEVSVVYHLRMWIRVIIRCNYRRSSIVSDERNMFYSLKSYNHIISYNVVPCIVYSFYE